jgi:phosphopantetheine adenylyltransferase
MLSKKKHLYVLESHEKRRWNVQHFLDMFDKELQLEVFSLEDGIGPYKRGKFVSFEVCFNQY